MERLDRKPEEEGEREGEGDRERERERDEKGLCVDLSYHLGYF